MIIPEANNNMNPIDILEKKLSLIDLIYSETLESIAVYLQNREIIYGNNLIEYLRNPEPYPGDPSLIKTIVIHNINLIISDHYHDLQREGLFVNSTFKQILFKIYPKIKIKKGGNYIQK